MPCSAGCQTGTGPCGLKYTRPGSLERVMHQSNPSRRLNRRPTDSELSAARPPLHHPSDRYHHRSPPYARSWGHMGTPLTSADRPPRNGPTPHKKEVLQQHLQPNPKAEASGKPQALGRREQRSGFVVRSRIIVCGPGTTDEAIEYETAERKLVAQLQ